jgi:YVTN family beta-propeller protein
MYVAISGSDHTAVVDLQKLTVVKRIKVGARPARNATAILPANRVNTPTASIAPQGTQAGR